MWLLLQRGAALCACACSAAATIKAAVAPAATMLGIRFIILDLRDGCVEGRIACKDTRWAQRGPSRCARPSFEPARILGRLSKPDEESIDMERTLRLGLVATGVAAALLAASVPGVAQDSTWEHPVTPWGDPDLRGMWPVNHMTGVPLVRP